MSKPIAEAFVMVLALLNPATADPIRRCLCSPFVKEEPMTRFLDTEIQTQIFDRPGAAGAVLQTAY